MENLMQLAREIREKPWWYEYGDLRLDHAAYEAEASSILLFSPMLVPGLLQTADYARAVPGAICFDRPAEEIERLVEFRMKRQKLLSEPDPPSLWAVIDEAVLCRMIGGPKIMHQQLKSLIEMASLPNITLQLLPFSGGAHAGLDGPFYVIRFHEPTDMDMVYFEHTVRKHYRDDSKALSLYLSPFDHLRAST